MLGYKRKVLPRIDKEKTMKTYTVKELKEKINPFIGEEFGDRGRGIEVILLKNFLSWLEKQEENTPTLKSLIGSWKFDWVNSDIEKNFKAEPVRSSDYKLFHFDEKISSENAIAKIKKEGYSPANYTELLSWKDWNDKDFVIALGSVAELDGCRCVLYLFEDGSERYFDLGWFGYGWRAGSRFLAVRNLGSKTLETSELGNLDSLKLEKDIFKCDKCNGQKVRVRGGGMICRKPECYRCDWKEEKTVKERRQRWARRGEKGIQYEGVLHTVCDRCGKCRHPIRSEWNTC